MISSGVPAMIAPTFSTRPDIACFGRGTPKQEFWMANHLGHIVTFWQERSL
jgi:UDP-N-acetyl-D-mannosaminuronic acid transferase (WecB/TagA/CpsF family)